MTRCRMSHLAIKSITWTIVFILGSAKGMPLSKVIIDTDAGIDDAVALFTALTDKTVDVLAITCVKGNTNIDNVVVNVLKVLVISGRTDIPVYSGIDHGLVNDVPLSYFFGKDGLGDVDNFPDPPLVDEKRIENAAVQLVKLVTENPGEITLIFLGPLTNLALAINLCPEFLSYARKVVIMGGSLRAMGNQAPGVEFNFYNDPDAASLVLQRAALNSQTVTILALEPINEAEISLDWRWEKFGKIKSKIVTFINEIETAHDKTFPQETYRPYDTGAICVALNPDCIKQADDLYAEIDTFGQAARGVLLIDYNKLTQRQANAKLIIKLDASVLKDYMYYNIKNHG